MTKQLTLYNSKVAPFGQRVEIALAEAKATFTRYEIDLDDKPAWYASQVNPESKVPAITYGGPEVPPDQPSPESVKLNESLVLVEFVADLYPESGILSKDPVLRAKARLFIDTLVTKFYAKFGSQSSDPEHIVQALEDIQALLPAQGFVLGEFSIADIAIAPFLLRLQLRFEHDLGGWEAGKGTGTKILQQPQLARLWEYTNALAARPSIASSWHKDEVLEKFTKRFTQLRAEKFGA